MRAPKPNVPQEIDRPAVAPHPLLLAAIRLTVAAVWIYEGLWLKMIRPAPHELDVVRSVAIGALTPAQLLFAIGCGETLLGLGVLSGWFWRPLAIFQAILLILMNGIGIAFSGPAIPSPVGLVIHNLPFLLCIVVLGFHGPGAWTLPRPGRRP
jgi:uncharacterized membrane protein YphA (DoxX/SURF4 family)